MTYYKTCNALCSHAGIDESSMDYKGVIKCSCYSPYQLYRWYLSQLFSLSLNTLEVTSNMSKYVRMNYTEPKKQTPAVGVELVLPSESDYPNDPIGYTTAVIKAQCDYRAKLFAAIDRRPNLRSERPVSMTPPAPTIHDYLAQRPALLKRYREIGPAALLEI